MKFYTYLLSLLFIIMSCQEEETLNLRDYPIPDISFTIQGSKDPLNSTINATYASDGTLTLDKNLSFNVVLATPLKEDVFIDLEYELENIPSEKITCPSQVVINAGDIEASVALDNLSFMDTLSEQNYGISVHAISIRTNEKQLQFHSDKAKMAIHKEGYLSSASLLGSKGNDYEFKRVYANNSILNQDKMAFTFKTKLSKVLNEDVEFRFEISDQNLSKYVQFQPEQIVIPAGQLESSEIRCQISDEFLLQSDQEEEYSFSISVVSVREYEYLNIASVDANINVNIKKTKKLFEQVAKPLSDWSLINRNGWIPSMPDNLSGKPIYAIDGKPNSFLSAYGDKKLWVVVELPEKKKVKGMHIDDYSAWYPPTEIQIFYSLNGTVLVVIGKENVVSDNTSQNLYFEFLTPITAKFFKYEVLSGRYGYKYIAEFNLFE